MGAFSIPLSTRTQGQTNPYLENIDAHLADPSVPLHPNSMEALRRAGAPVGINAPGQPGEQLTPQITGPTPEVKGIGQPPASPAMPLPGGVRGNAANNFNTTLSPGEEPQFQSWKSEFAPKDSGEDYDLRGAYKYGLTPSPENGHWSDRFKKPNEPTFSNESQYAQDAPQKAGHWNGDTYVPPAAIAPPPGAHAAPTPVQPVAKTPGAIEAEKHMTDLAASPSGLAQVKSPWARVPLQIAEGLGNALSPRFMTAIPGTQLHHNMLVGQAENAVGQQAAIRKQQEEAETAAATREHLEAESENQRAMSQRERQAPHPTITTDKGIIQWNPQTNRFDIPAGNAPVKEEMEGKTITTDQGIMQWNPATKSYDIKAGDAPEKEAAEKTLQDSDGVWYKVGKDNTAVPITMNGQPFKGKMPSAAGDDFAQFYQKYLKEKGLPDTASNEKKARTEWSAVSQAPERPPQALMLVPGENGQMTGQVVRPGTSIAGTAMTAAGLNRENATPTQMLNREGQARIIKTAGDQLISSIEKNRGKLGNLGSYWTQATNGSPIADPDTAGLMAQLSSFAALQPTLHGFRSEAALRGFEHIIGGVPKNPDALIAAIKAIQGTAGIIEGGGGRANQPAGGAIPEVKTQAEFDALPKGARYTEDGKPFTKP